MSGPRFAYAANGGVYLNVTSRCHAACSFCGKFGRAWDYGGLDLRLPREPDAAELAAAALRTRRESGAGGETVFCGYGEPTLRLPVVLEAAPLLRADGARRLRVNTLGLGSASAGRDIVPDLAAAVDAVSVSLNAGDAATWRAVVNPRPDLAEDGYARVLDFIRACVRSGLETTATAVALPGVDLVAAEAAARSTGARFRLRPLF